MEFANLQYALLAAVFALPLHAGAASLYDFNGNLDDSFANGPALVANGGSVSAGAYVFGPNQGLSLNWSSFDAASYDITLQFSFTTTGAGASWRKIVDYNGRDTDEGLYAFDDHLQFVETASNTGPEVLINAPFAMFAPDQTLTLRITRDAGTKVFSAYINGAQQLSFVDSNERAVFITPFANFFLDDIDTSGEFSAGRADFIAIGAVPVPAALPLLGSALGLLGWRNRRRR